MVKGGCGIKAIVIEEPGKIAIKEVPFPKRKKGEALLKVLYGGICGSDLGSYRGTFAYFDYPRIPGHEFSAEIVEIDENTYGLEKGMIVTCNPYFNCGHCYSCEKGLVNACMDNKTMGCQMNGAFQEYITMPLERIYDGKGLAPNVLAAIEPFCIGYHGVQRAGIRPGDKVLVVGGGTIGVLAANAAKAMGAEIYLCDIPPAEEKVRRSVETFGFAGYVLNEGPEGMQEAVKRLTGISEVGGRQEGKGFDICIEAVGLPATFQTCMDCAAFGGKVILIGVGKQNLDFNFTLIQKKELNIYGSRNARKNDFLELIDLVKDGKTDLEKIITNTYDFKDAAAAFAEFDKNAGNMLKVELDFSKIE